MRIQLVCIGTRLPIWVDLAFEFYASRMPHQCALALKAYPLAKRHKGGDLRQPIEQECAQLLKSISRDSIVVALDVRGALWDTDELTLHLKTWLQSGRSVAMLMGGPDGLSERCLNKADYHWSLSPLTFPHALARVIVAEQLFRAWSILSKHPYHRK